MDCDFFFLNIEIVLKSQPKSRAHPKVLRKSKSRICCNSPSSFNDLRNSRLRDTGIFRQSIRANPHRIKKFFFQDFSRMDVR